MLYIHIGKKVMINKNKIEKNSSIVLFILGTVLVIDGVLIQFLWVLDKIPLQVNP
jgi:hypothetical protein